MTWEAEAEILNAFMLTHTAAFLILQEDKQGQFYDQF